MRSNVFLLTLFHSKRSLMSFWTKESHGQNESGKSMMDGEWKVWNSLSQVTFTATFFYEIKPTPLGLCKATIFRARPPSPRENVRGWREWRSKWKLTIENCVFAAANWPLPNVDCGFWISTFGNEFCTEWDWIQSFHFRNQLWFTNIKFLKSIFQFSLLMATLGHRRVQPNRVK